MSGQGSGGFSFPPSDEQAAIVAAGVAGRRVKTAAFAGAGKSATAKRLAAAIAPKPMLYIAYNNSMAAEMRASMKHLRHVTVSTPHALAMHEVGQTYRDRLETRSFAIREAIEKRFGARLMRLSYNARRAADAVLDAVGRFQNSADLEISVSHVLPNPEIVASARSIADVANDVFEAMIDPNDTFPITHDTYFKLWQIKRPRLDSRFFLIVFDECQDASPVMLDVFDDQQCAKVAIGDSHQSLYGFRDAVNALESLNGYEDLPLTQSWRFGPEVAILANQILTLKGERRTLRGTPSIPTQVVTSHGGLPDLVLTRSNAGVFDEALSLVDAGHAVSIVGGVDELIGMVMGAYELFAHGRSTHAAFRFFRNFTHLRESLKGPRGNEYAPWVNIVDGHKDTLPEKCAKIREGIGSSGAVRLSTVHKAKGLGASHVRLGSDFQPFCAYDPRSKRIEFRPEEANVYYVAITRAERILELGATFAAAYEVSMRAAHTLFGFPEPVPIEEALAACRRQAEPAEVGA